MTNTIFIALKMSSFAPKRTSLESIAFLDQINLYDILIWIELDILLKNKFLSNSDMFATELHLLQKNKYLNNSVVHKIELLCIYYIMKRCNLDKLSMLNTITHNATIDIECYKKITLNTPKHMIKLFFPWQIWITNCSTNEGNPGNI